ncbi:hypothetical protein LCGC14_1781390 [marine sediment metagenome]|uniref:Uncharacterized protein n=1 Tax=marine sediment metagenome TaxID=412755 RepID=A0A0F9JUW1_9ZZZZ
MGKNSWIIKYYCSQCGWWKNETCTDKSVPSCPIYRVMMAPLPCPAPKKDSI